jgi:hypothetical protein
MPTNKSSIFYDTNDDAEGLLTKGLARSDHGDEAMVPVLGC